MKTEWREEVGWEMLLPLKQRLFMKLIQDLGKNIEFWFCARVVPQPVRTAVDLRESPVGPNSTLSLPA